MKSNNLTETDYRIWEVISELTSQHPKVNVSSIADIANVAPSSIIRFAQKLGYSGWSEMYLDLKSVKYDQIIFDFQDFNFVDNETMNNYFDKIWKIIDSKNIIFVTAIGDCAYVGNYLVSKLWELNYKAVNQRNFNYEINKTKNESGVSILLNESGAVLLKTCLQAKEEGIDVISITSNGQSPLAIHSDISLELSNSKSKLDTYTPNLFTARLLLFIELMFEYRNNY